MKALAALSLTFMLGSAGPPSVERLPYITSNDGVVRLECFGPQGASSGSAIHLGDGKYITAAHVIEDAECGIGPNIIRITYADYDRDFATFDALPIGSVLPISCQGFRAGSVYLARGYAGGGATSAFLPWLASPFPIDGLETFTGEAIPGMSGGPVLDAKGRVVGIVLRRTPAAAISLKTTPICNRS